MLSSTRNAIACIVLIIGVAVSTHSQTTSAPKDLSATVSGKITVKGKGVAGIVVGLRPTNIRYYSRETSPYRGITDQDGKYTITNVPPGTFEVIPAAPGYVPLDGEGRKSLIVNKGETIDGIDFTFVRGGVITGRVTDGEGRPVIEEAIFVVPYTPKMTQYGYIGTRAATDDRGIYRLYGLPAGLYRVGAGQEYDDSMGRMGRSYYKRAYHPDAADPAQATVIELTEGSEAKNVDITLGRLSTTYTVSGRIVDGETGKPVPNIPYGLMQYVRENYTTSMTNGAVSNSQGEFRFQDLAPGKYGIFITPESNTGFRADNVRFEVSDADVTGLLMKTAKGGASMSGVVVLEGMDDKAVQAMLGKTQLHAFVVKNNPDDNSQSVTLNPDGTFHFTNLRAGLTRFALSARDQRLRMERVERDGVIQTDGIELKDGDHVTGVRIVARYGNATLRGVIKFENGTPPSNGRLFVNIRKVVDDPSTMAGIMYHESTRVDARGQFLMEGLTAATYEVTVGIFIPNAPNVPQTSQQVTVTAGSVTDIVVKLDLKDTTRRP